MSFIRNKRLLGVLFIMIVVLVMTSLNVMAAGASSVKFSDKNLEACVRDALGIKTGTITASDMAELRELYASGKAIKDLTGLEYAINIERLVLSDNQISSIKQLAKLSRLKDLRLRNNRLTDIKPLALLTGLVSIDLGKNTISDISAVSGMINLKNLDLIYNQIKEISPLVTNSVNGGLSSGSHIDVRYNYIDIASGSQASTDVKTLLDRGVDFLYDDQIDKISPYVKTTSPVNSSRDIKLDTGITISFNEEIQEADGFSGIAVRDSKNKVIPSKIEININKIIITPEINFNCGTLYNVTIPSGAIMDMSRNALTSNYKMSFTTEAKDRIIPRIKSTNPANDSKNIALDSVITVDFSEIIVSGDYYNNITMSDLNGRNCAITLGINGNRLTIKGSSNMNPRTTYMVVIPAGAVKDNSGNNLSEAYTFRFTTTVGPWNVKFQDKAFEGAVRRALNKSTGVITAEDMQGLKVIRGENALIKDITGIEYAVNLEELYLAGNDISNIKLISGLTSLKVLVLDRNKVSDISYLSNIQNLEELHLWDNQVADISGLSRLTKLHTLDLRNNLIENISPLEKLVLLQKLSLSGNKIKSIQPVSALVVLQSLNLSSNRIVDIMPLGSLRALEDLDISNNDIADISVLQNIASIIKLNLSFNEISGVASLSNLLNIKYLNLSDNEIRDITPLSNLHGVEELYLGRNNINDISAISSLTSLKKLSLWKTRITDISPLALNYNNGGLRGSSIDIRWNFIDTRVNSQAKMQLDSMREANILYNPQNEIIPPVVISSIPAANGTQVEVKNAITINFSENIAGSSQYDGISLEGSDGSRVSIDKRIEGSKLIITPGETLHYAVDYSLLIPADSVQDVVGNAFKNSFTMKFTTKKDNDAPAIKTTSPVHLSSFINPGMDIIISFNENVQKGDRFEEIVVKDYRGALVKITKELSGDTLKIDPVDVLQYGRKYTVIIPAGIVKDMVEGVPNSFKASYTFTFTTADNTAPTVKSCSPSNGYSSAKVTSPIVITFSKNITEGVNFSNIKITDSNSRDILYKADIKDNILTLKPNSNLGFNMKYTVVVPRDAVKDTVNNILANDYRAAFTTEKDSIKPEVVLTDPLKDSRDIPVSSAISITFSEDIQQGTYFNNITMKDSEGRSVYANCTINGSLLEITPVGQLSYGTLYTVTIPYNSVKDSSGNTMSTSYSFSFTTEADETAPSIISITPIKLSNTIEIKFSEYIHRGTDFSSIVIRDNTGNTVTFTSRISGDKLIITPSTSLVSGATYTLYIPAQAIQDASGNVLEEDLTHSFVF